MRENLIFLENQLGRRYFAYDDDTQSKHRRFQFIDVTDCPHGFLIEHMARAAHTEIREACRDALYDVLKMLA